MNPIFYDSYPRFENRIVKHWIKKSFKYNYGHLQLLSYSWQTKLYWSNRNDLKRSKKNTKDIQQLSCF